MIIDKIMQSYCELEKDHHKNGSPLPTAILLSLDAYRKLPPQINCYQDLEDLKICGLPVSITDTKDFDFSWEFPKKPKTVTVIQP